MEKTQVAEKRNVLSARIDAHDDLGFSSEQIQETMGRDYTLSQGVAALIRGQNPEAARQLGRPDVTYDFQIKGKSQGADESTDRPAWGGEAWDARAEDILRSRRAHLAAARHVIGGCC